MHRADLNTHRASFNLIQNKNVNLSEYGVWNLSIITSKTIIK
jgi:hypothetical protein